MAFERTEGSRPARPIRRGRKTSLSVQRSFPAV